MFARIWSNWNFHTLLLRMKNGMATLENNCFKCFFFGGEVEVKYILNINPSSSILRYSCKGNENICSMEESYSTIHSRLIENEMKWNENNQNIQRVNKQIVLYLYNELLIGNLKGKHYWHKQHHGWIPKPLHKVKTDQRLQSIRFHV